MSLEANSCYIKVYDHTSKLISGGCIWVSFITLEIMIVLILYMLICYCLIIESDEWNPNTSSRNQLRCMVIYFDVATICFQTHQLIVIFSPAIIPEYSNSAATKQHKEGIAKDFRLTSDIN